MNFTYLNPSFTDELPADPVSENYRRQVFQACYSLATPRKASQPKLISYSKEVAEMLGLSKADCESEEFTKVFVGNEILPNTKPFAMCYGGHQFGNWAGQLGDGRAINLTEVVFDSKRFALQLKGAGETPYSRTADGLAVLRSSIREYLCSEAMFHLGVPTTRALSLIQTGDQVLRDVMYNGNAAYEPGAVVCRVAPSFVRFGNFEIFSSRKDHESLQKLTDYTIRNFFPHLGEPCKESYIAFFDEVVNKTLGMIVHWQRVGFVHGVMNTDNMSILGLTIDFGPYGWLEDYNPNWTPNTTDLQHKRYRFGNQPDIALWNLYQLGNALYPLIKETKPLETILHRFVQGYEGFYAKMMAEKLGFEEFKNEDRPLIYELVEVLPIIETDYTIFFRKLANIRKEETDYTRSLAEIADSFYNLTDFTPKIMETWLFWLEKYHNRLKQDLVSDADRKKQMNAVNPKYVFRNYMAHLAIEKAEKGDFQLVNDFLDLLRKPYDEQPENEQWFVKRPDWAREKVGCSMLSCSS